MTEEYSPLSGIVRQSTFADCCPIQNDDELITDFAEVLDTQRRRNIDRNPRLATFFQDQFHVKLQQLLNWHLNERRWRNIDTSKN